MTACTKPAVEIRYVDRPIEKLVQVPCELPKVSCIVDMNATYTEKVNAIGKCIENHRSRDELLSTKN